MQQINTHGGKRNNSGRKPHNRETKLINFRVYSEHAEAIKNALRPIIKSMNK